jgi:hypothetical protein
MEKRFISLILFETIETNEITIKRPPFVLCHLHSPGAGYACELLYDSLPKYLSDELEKLQRKACRIILPGHSHKNAFNELSLTSLPDRRQNLTNKLFKTIVNNPQNKLHHLLPILNPSEVSPIVRRKFLVPNFRQLDVKTILSNVIAEKEEYT